MNATHTIQYESPIGPKNDVLTQVRHWINRFVVFQNPAHPLVLSLWALHSWAFDAAYVTPYIYITSTEPGCGKTTTAEALEAICKNGKLAGSLSASVLFRTVDAEDVTLFIDEADTVWSGAKNEDLRNVMNTGYKRNGNVMRVVNGEPRDFCTFAPKLMAGIDNAQLPATIADRTMKIVLRKAKKENLQIERFITRKVTPQAEALKEVIRAWASVDRVEEIGNIDLDPIDGVSDRQWDIAEPLLQIAQHFGILDEATDAILSVFHGQKEETPLTRVLNAAKELFESTGVDRITNGQLAEATGYTPGVVSRMISPLGIQSRPIKIAGQTVRGYYRPEFEAAWEAYL